MPFAPTCVPVVLQLELLAVGQAVPGELDGLQLGAEDGLLRLDVDGGLLVARAGRVVLAPALRFCNREAAAVRPAKRGDPRGGIGVGGREGAGAVWAVHLAHRLGFHQASSGAAPCCHVTARSCATKGLRAR